MRKSTVLLILIGALALSAPSRARDITLHKTSVEEMKTTCAKAGGRFSQDAGGYGCGTNCHGDPGTDRTVYCKAEQKCFAQVIGARRPHTVAEALTKPERHAR